MRYKQIVDMARQAGAWPELSETPVKDVAFLKRFAELVFEQGRQEGMKQERALWKLTKLGQEIEAQPAQRQPLIHASLADKQFERYYRQGYDAGIKAQRPWVGLTDGEIDECDWGQSQFVDLARAIEAKLKEKNT
jgi:hypothetical protein